MTPVSQLIWRNRHRLKEATRLLLVAPAADDLAILLEQCGHTPEAICLSHGSHRRLQAKDISSRFSLTGLETAQFSRIVLFQPREKALLEMMLEFCGSLLGDYGEMWLAGENRAGIKSAGKRLTRYFDRFEKLDSARHCTLFAARAPSRREPFALDRHFSEWQFETGGHTIGVSSLPGVFAHGRLDAGTQLLLQALETVSPHPGGRILDFACGAGVVGLALAAAAPGCELTLLDDSLVALESARQSLKLNGFEARLVASEGLATLLDDGEPGFDWIVSNPPFHAGVRQELDTARRFVTDCPRLMTGGGRLCLVANSHLPYGEWLPELFGTIQVLAANPAYNVWLASGPET